MDQQLLRLLNRDLASVRLDDLMLLVSVAALVVLPGLGLWMLWHRRHRRAALTLVGALAASLLLTLLLQLVVARPRPDDVRLVLPAPAFCSFPSGHAALAWCAAVLLSLTYRSRGLLCGSLLGAALVSVSRVYLGHHYPSDVLGGALLGAGVGALFHGLWLGVDRTLAGRLRWVLWPQLALVAIITEVAYLGLLPRWSGGLPHADKLLHFLLFGLLAFLVHLWLRGRRVALGRVALPLALPLVLVPAALEELAQLLSRSRSADVTDLLCDLAGMLLFVWLGDRLLRRRPATPLGSGAAP